MKHAKLKRTALILASASPRRAELLREVGLPFTVLVSPDHEPEQKPAAIPIDLWPMCLAYMKAAAVHRLLQTQSPKRKTPKSKIKNRKSPPRPIILAADTIVVAGTHILNKARDRAHARHMLLSLQGKTHRVITGICLMQSEPCGDGPRVRLASAEALCRIRRMSRHWLDAYLDSNLWQGKAGAYGIQDPATDPFVELLSGEFSTVVGLPMQLVQSELASFAEDAP